VDVAGVEHVGHLLHHEVILLLGGDAGLAAELRGDVALLQELVHRLVGFVVAGLLLGEFGDNLVK